MPFVIDASVAACWAFDDEDHPVAHDALDRLRRDAAAVPGLWWFEVCNTLVVNERRGRIDEAAISRFMRMLSRLPIIVDRDLIEIDLIRAAREHRLSGYDAAYLELAVRQAIPLATLDMRLASAATAAGVSMLSAS